MAAEAQAGSWNGVSRRRTPRFPAQSVVDVTVLRSGIPDTVPGRSVNVCESGIAAMLSQELVPGETVAIEMQLSPVTAPLQTRAVARYQDRLRIGLEFVGLPPEHHEAIRSWIKETKPEAEVSANPTALMAIRSAGSGTANPKTWSTDGRRKRKGRFGIGWMMLLVLVALAAAVGWWRWNRGWRELEAGLNPATSSTEMPRVQVPAQVMQKLLVHRVEPSYPAEARKANLQGIIAVDIVVGRDGSILNMRAINGPDVLARAAMDALRWWKFEPYRVNGEPVLVETTVAVEFKR